MPISIHKGECWNLATIEKMGRNGFFINKEYQRSKVWKPDKQRRLIESIIRDLSIGVFIVKHRDDQTYEVLDGQQRLESIFLFIEERITTPVEFEEFSEKKYSDLQNDTARYPTFENFKIYYEEVIDGTDAQLADIFLRLQEGTPLNAAEKLNATHGKMRDFVYELSKHGLFKNDINISEFRFAHRFIAAQMVLLELESDFTAEPLPAFGNPRFGKLKAMYKEFECNIPKWLKKRVYRTVNSIHNTLGTDAHVLCEKSDLPMVYLLTTYLNKWYAVERTSLKKFLIDFFTRVAQVKLIEGRKPRGPYQEFANVRSKGLTPETLKTRFRILLGLFLLKAPNLHLKDPVRMFDNGQKLAIYYYKNKGICQLATCHRKVEWVDASFHHMVFHRQGGPTTVENGQLMHRACHVALHANIGNDDDMV
jgi:hypothetical protein